MPILFVSARGEKETVPRLDNTGVTGRYLASDGTTGEAVWGTSGPWMALTGVVNGAPVTVAILDHPSSYNHPTYWHARGYGLFAANPIGRHAFDPKQPPRESHYSGHLNDTTAARYGRPGLAPLFPDEKTEVTIRPNHYMVMGDNTMNSSDSRTWGDFSRTNVIGKYFFVYWPFSSRFGWAPR